MASKEDALALDSRRLIYEYIKETPGAHLRKVHRGAALPFGQVLYHLAYLERHGLIVVRKDGKFNRYFVKNLFRKEEKDMLAIVRHDVPRRLAILLMFTPRLTHKDMLAYVDVSPSTLSFHLQKMIESGVLAKETLGRESFYWVADERTCAKVLILHRESFDSEVVDRFADVWLSMNFLARTEREKTADEDPVLRQRAAGSTLLHRVLGHKEPSPVEAA